MSLAVHVLISTQLFLMICSVNIKESVTVSTSMVMHDLWIEG